MKDGLSLGTKGGVQDSGNTIVTIDVSTARQVGMEELRFLKEKVGVWGWGPRLKEL